MIITYDYLIPGTTLFTVPTGVTTLDGYGWGAGGGGAGRVVAGGGGGGAGGAFAWQRFSVTPGSTLTVVVGTPAPTAVHNGGSGALSWFGNTGTTGLVAMGGAGGVTTSGGIGTTVGSIGISIYPGGNGANPGASFGGAGGAGAARFSVGQNAVGISQGFGVSLGGGNGGRGRSGIGIGFGGTRAGGGGGGAFRTTATNRVGGIGGNGRISLEMEAPILIQHLFNTGLTTYEWQDSNITAVGLSNMSLSQLYIANDGWPTQPHLVTLPLDGNTGVTESVANNQYFTIQLTAVANKVVNISSINFYVGRGGASTPRGVCVRGSGDGFASNLYYADIATANPIWTIVEIDLSGDSNYQNQSGALTFRFYTYAPSSANSIDYDNITVNGTVTDLITGETTPLRRRFVVS